MKASCIKIAIEILLLRAVGILNYFFFRCGMNQQLSFSGPVKYSKIMVIIGVIIVHSMYI